MKLLLVEWVDSAGCPAGWQHAEDVTPAMAIVQSVGWLLKETKEFLFLAPHINKTGTSDRPQIAGHITIPRGVVKRQSILRVTSSSRSRP